VEGFTEVPIAEFGGAYTRVPPGKVPNGLAIDARNVRFSSEVLNIRPGRTSQWTSVGANDRITGFHQFKTQTAEKINAYFTSSGWLEREVSNGGNAPKRIVSLFDPVSFYASNPNQFILTEMTDAYNRLYMAFRSSPAAPGTKPVVLNAAPQQYYLDAVTNQMTNNLIGLLPNTAPPTGSSSPGAGNVKSGLRYAVVLGYTNTGYVGGATSAAILSINVAADGHSLHLTGIPVFSQANVSKRVVAFTPAGGSTGGPWFYNLNDTVVDGITNKSTVIPDNSSTSFDFDFTDEFIFSLVDQTAAIFDVKQIPNVTGLYYSKVLKRLIGWGDDEFTWSVSGIDDPETFSASAGFVQCGHGDSQKSVGAIDFKTETLFLKNGSGYIVADSTGDPAAWFVPRKWEGSGPWGPRAYDVCDDFMAYASPTGLYVYFGDVPKYIGFANHGTLTAYWSRINKDYGDLVWLTIDVDRKEILIGVPLDADTIPSHVICVDYSRGLDKIRWSFDDCWALNAHVVQRDPPASNDPQMWASILKTKQVLYVSSAFDGVINLQDPTRQDDNGAGIDEYYQTAYLSLKAAKINGVYKLGGVDVVASGLGKLVGQVYPVRTAPAQPAGPFPLVNEDRVIDLHGETEVFHRNFDGRNASWFSFSFSNNKQPGNYFELHSFSAWMAVAWENRV